MQSSVNDAGGTKKGGGYDVARFQWIEPQALIQFGRKSIRLCPRREVTELLSHDGAGPVFHCPAYDRTIAPQLSRKSESITHGRPHLRRIEGWANNTTLIS